MASFKIALLLFICLEGCALTSAFNVDALQNVPDSLRATGDVCQDCTQIFELIADLFSNADLQKKMMDGIDRICALLPGPTAKLCKDEVEKMLPVAINFMTAIVKPAEACKILGLCGSSCDRQEKMLSYFVKEALQGALASENELPSSQCTICIFIIKTLEDLLPKARTEEEVIHLMQEICHILPSSYRDQCEAIMGKFGKAVLDALMTYGSPQSICALIRMCKGAGGQEAPLVDPCTLTTFRCRDFKTALKCGTVFYCQKFAWKPLNNF